VTPSVQERSILESSIGSRASSSAKTDPGESVRLRRLLSRERQLWRVGSRYVAGVDEAGRGPLAGPVVAAAVVFPRDVWIPGVDDSKKLSPSKREELFSEIRDHAVSMGVGIVDRCVIDIINIREASLMAMKSALSQLNPRPDYVLVDGNYFRSNSVRFETIVHGDAKVFSIAAASIVAKVIRDKLMQGLHLRYPEYGFDRHKGYATKQHIAAIQTFGRCDIHRQTFRVRRVEE
jgi:ribonuclease HII